MLDPRRRIINPAAEVELEVQDQESSKADLTISLILAIIISMLGTILLIVEIKVLEETRASMRIKLLLVNLN